MFQSLRVFDQVDWGMMMSTIFMVSTGEDVLVFEAEDRFRCRR